ncbi:MAG TPA: hypothetical protein V6D27_10500 [Vampirovibrionales bacterium]
MNQPRQEGIPFNKSFLCFKSTPWGSDEKEPGDRTPVAIGASTNKSF